MLLNVAEIDQHIVESIKNGKNDKVLSYLYERTLGKVRRHILKNNGSAEEANDIFQDAVIIFFHQVKQNKFLPGQEVDGFIFTVARNLWVDRIRREKRKVNTDFNGDHPHSEHGDYLKDLISKEKTSAMQKAFLKLDEKCRKILHFAVYDKLSMKEISEKMGYSSENVAKTNHYRCKQYLSRIVKEDVELLNLLKN